MNRAVFRFSSKKEVNRAYDAVSVMGVRESNGPFFDLGESEQLITVTWHENDKAEADARKCITRLVEEFGGVHMDKAHNKVA